MSFVDLQLDQELLNAVERLGFVEPTEVQKQAIPHILSSSQDLIALAQTGTGKTGAFSLPCLQKIDIEIQLPQLLILAPTRELALQIARDVKKFSKFKKGLKSVAVYGGADVHTQARALKNGCQVVVGTPGRTLDFIRRKKLNLEHIQMVVLDEADEMLKMGFQEDLEGILADTPETKQTMLFSATMPKSIATIAKRYMDDPHRITVGKKNVGADNVEHCYFMIQARDRYLALKRLVDSNPHMYGIIFCRTRVETSDIVVQLRKDGYDVDLISGELSQKQRDHVMRQFRKKNLQLLVATDVAARGIDVEDLTHIINFNLPDDLEVYVHRSGRTGRAGKAGHSFSLLTSREIYRLRGLEKMVGKKFSRQLIPSGEDVSRAQLQSIIQQIGSTEVSETLVSQFGELVDSELAGFEPREAVLRMLTVMCGQVLSSYEHAPDLNQRAQGDSDRGSRRSPRGRNRRSERGHDGGGSRGERPQRPRKERTFTGNFTRCLINIGRQQRLSPNRLMGLVNQHYPGRPPEFGRIEIQQKETFFDIDSQAVSALNSSVSGQVFEGKSIEIVVL